MHQHNRGTYLLRHGKFLIKNAATFTGIPYDGNVVVIVAKELLELVAMQRIKKKKDVEYTDKLNECFDMMDENYDFVDLTAKGDVKINDKSGLNSRKNNKIRTQRPKTDTAAHWVQEMIPNQLTLETTRDEVSRMSIVVWSTDADLKVEMIRDNRIKISLGDKSACMDFSTAAKIILKYLKGGNPVDAYLLKANANGLAVPRKMQKITPNVDADYRPHVPPESPVESSDPIELLGPENL